MTTQELNKAYSTLDDMGQKIQELQEIIQEALVGKTRSGVPLAPATIQVLKNKYQNEKAELVDMYNILP